MMAIPKNLLIFLMMISVPAAAQNSAWFRNAGYGLFFHFLPSGAGFQKYEDNFNVKEFASDCRAAGASYVIFTIGQNSGYYNAPNKAYDTYTGHSKGERCSSRDLPKQLARALKRKGIRFMLYVSGDLPCDDSAAAQKLGGVIRLNNENGQNWVYNNTLADRWSTVIRTWSKRYRKLVSGWWVDGCYTKSGFNDSYARVLGPALKAGNASAIVCYNTGLNYDKVADEDYLAGEERNILAPICPGPTVDGAQWHELSFLGSDWGQGDPRCSSLALYKHIKDVNSHGGVVSIDVRLDPNYTGYRINSKHMAVLKGMKAFFDQKGS